MYLPILTQLEYLLRIVVAMLCGAVIGYERESRLKTAGIRTHLIVSLAAALMMIVSKYGFSDVLTRSGVGLDPSRIAAGVVTAIGFLGAGVIFVRKQNVSGITTSAGIWATVGVGITIGSGMYAVGVAAALLIILVQVILHRNTRLVRGATTAQLTVRIPADQPLDQLFDGILAKRKIDVTGMKATKLDDDILEVKLLVKCPDKYDAADLVQLLREIPAVQGIEI